MVKCNKLGRERQCTSLTHGKRLPPIGAQFVCFTHPHIGNVGTNGDDMECEKCHMKGIIVRDRPTIVSNYRSKMDIDAFCKDQGIVGIADIDTRALTRIVREYGCLNGVITSDMTKSVEELAAMAKAFDISATGGPACRASCVARHHACAFGRGRGGYRLSSPLPRGRPV